MDMTISMGAGIHTSGEQDDATLVRINQSTFPQARCLDGSPGAYYVRKPLGIRRHSWVFVLEGGSFCSSFSSCRDRSLTDLGSSSRYPERWQLQEPYLSRSSRDNPLLHDWGVAYLKSCDGAYFAGTAGAVTASTGAVLHYNGEGILRAAVEDLASRDQNFKQASEILVAGCSAGGIAVLAQLDAIKDMLARCLNDHVQIHGFSDSGFYLARPQYSMAKSYIIHGQRAGGLVPSECLRNNHRVAWNCFIAQVGYTYLKTPVFIWQSRYDTDQFMCEMEDACRQNSSCVDAYGQELSQQVHMAVRHIPNSGAFIDGCAHHCWGSFAGGNWIPWRSPASFKVNGITPVQALSHWYTRVRSASRKLILRGLDEFSPFFVSQAGIYPCMECCAGAGP